MRDLRLLGKRRFVVKRKAEESWKNKVDSEHVEL